MMRILEALQTEHRLIERVAGALVTFAEESPLDGAALGSFCDFLASYADEHHHGMEESILFRALRDAELPEQGPIAMLRAEHADNRAAIEALRSGADGGELAAHARRFCARLWEHIDKEESVLFPEIEVRLALERARLDRELDALEPVDERLVQLGESLAVRFPPRTVVPGFARGDGCSACRHFGDACQGVEREWWTETEWEGFHSRDF